MRFQFIENHRDEFPVKRMCKVLDVSRSGYYAWRGRPPSEREMANRALYKKIKEVYTMRATGRTAVHASITNSRNKVWPAARIVWHG